jgi:hypothetical protein
LAWADSLAGVVDETFRTLSGAPRHANNRPLAPATGRNPALWYLLERDERIRPRPRVTVTGPLVRTPGRCANPQPARPKHPNRPPRAPRYLKAAEARCCREARKERRAKAKPRSATRRRLHRRDRHRRRRRPKLPRVPAQGAALAGPPSKLMTRVRFPSPAPRLISKTCAEY